MHPKVNPNRAVWCSALPSATRPSNRMALAPLASFQPTTELAFSGRIRFVSGAFGEAADTRNPKSRARAGEHGDPSSLPPCVEQEADISRAQLSDLHPMS